MVANAFIRRARVVSLASVGALVVVSGCAAHRPVSAAAAPEPSQDEPRDVRETPAAEASSVDAPAAIAPDNAVSQPLQVGEASFYSSKFQGRRTASGERYDMNALTAAHRTLPLGSYVRVSNVSRTRSVVVRINDRGPFVKGRMIDLSFAAASLLGLRNAGHARVLLEPVEPIRLQIAQPVAASNKARVYHAKAPKRPMKLRLAHPRRHGARARAQASA
ncbi:MULTISPECIES: septal ring lytic transglycosylase RlpA family protein [unclassified Caballeronia]|uniref:septal ring lytic transglycosylase RlpA family protein n=1 Tax=unclassified Caballeronia TaxID=2646786 RepID=UPI00285A44DD|nr:MULTISPECIES: septal ring lytic transglycosylase RlpA family protein [unclassified Caballeronia]MDR5740823.1 septal ring lytic transglycosylase RlpA family protein [Caballeronia sp. LZ016]MDR5808656.1 septal ring lytic transglycosylase RlpA family protein [Caballeronia sp. LZ019]